MHSRLSAVEAMNLLARRAPALAAVYDLAQDPWDGGDPIVVHDGHVSVRGDFAVGPEITVVLGDLEVGGWLSDTKDADVTLLLVTGSVRADRVLFCSEVSILGDLHVGSLVYTNCLNDWRLIVGGDLVAKALVEGGTYCEIGGRVTVPHVLSLQNAIVAGPDRAPVVERRARLASEFLHPDLLESDYPSLGAIREAMNAGAPLLLSDGGNPA